MSTIFTIIALDPIHFPIAPQDPIGHRGPAPPSAGSTTRSAPCADGALRPNNVEERVILDGLNGLPLASADELSFSSTAAAYCRRQVRPPPRVPSSPSSSSTVRVSTAREASPARPRLPPSDWSQQLQSSRSGSGWSKQHTTATTLTGSRT
jgi:hypothetical protein